MQNPLRPVRITLAAAATALALALTACSGQPADTASPSPAPTSEAAPTETPTPEPTPEPIPPSNTIDGITVNDVAGAQPEIIVPAPFAIDETRTRVITEGTGPAATETSILELHYRGMNGRTGEEFESSWSRGAPIPFPLAQGVPGFQKGLLGAKPGDRRLIVIPGSDGYDSAGGSGDGRILVGDTLVFVVDVLAVSVAEATGEPTGAQLPVELGDDGGKPTITIPAGAAAPTENQAIPVIRGTQRAVGETDVIQVRYRTWSWKNGQLLEDVWDTADQGELAGTIEAWKTGIAGQPIGSRVLVVAPNAYPQGSQQPPVEAGDTMVYVVDILFASPAA